MAKLMNQNDIYVKTPLGEEAMTQRTRVVQRSQRMVLVLVDGKTTVAELGEKIGDVKLAMTALAELEAGGFIAPKHASGAVPAPRPLATPSQVSQFSTFGPKSTPPGAPTVVPSQFSTFGRPQPPRPQPSQTPQAQSSPAAMRADPGMAPVRPVKPRQPVSPGKWIAGGLALLLLAGVAVVFLYPYEQHRAALASRLERQLGLPVEIGGIGPHPGLPPQLALRDVRLGKSGGDHFEQLRLPGLFAALSGNAEAPPEEIFAQGGRLDLESLAAWLDHPLPGVPARIRLQNVRIDLGSLPLATVSGDILHTRDGLLQSASLASTDRAFKLDLTAQGRTLEIGLEARDWKPEANSPEKIDYFSGKGRLEGRQLVFPNADVRVFDGRYEGDLHIGWGETPGITGSGNLRRINAARLFAFLLPELHVQGDLSGTLRFQAEGTTPGELRHRLTASGDWRLERGEIQAVDLVEAMRRGRGQTVRGGSTRFERLSTRVGLSPSGVQLADLQLDAGLLRASGRIDASAAGEVHGRLAVSLARGPMSTTGSVQIQGRLPTLEAVQP
jgi:hypothetical protein